MTDDEFDGVLYLRAAADGYWFRGPDGTVVRIPVLADGSVGRHEVVCGRPLEDGRLCGRAPHAGDCNPEGGRL